MSFFYLLPFPRRFPTGCSCGRAHPSGYLTQCEGGNNFRNQWVDHPEDSSDSSPLISSPISNIDASFEISCRGDPLKPLLSGAGSWFQAGFSIKFTLGSVLRDFYLEGRPQFLFNIIRMSISGKIYIFPNVYSSSNSWILGVGFEIL